jgi:hypothetical protein
MRSYRLLLLDKNGLLVGKAAVNCREDEEAIAVAEREVQKCEYVEVWKGGRPIRMCARSLKREVRLAALLRSWRPAWRPEQPRAVCLVQIADTTVITTNKCWWCRL